MSKCNVTFFFGSLWNTINISMEFSSQDSIYCVKNVQSLSIPLAISYFRRTEMMSIHARKRKRQSKDCIAKNAFC